METLKDVLLELVQLIPDYEKREEATKVVNNWLAEPTQEDEKEVNNES